MSTQIEEPNHKRMKEISEDIVKSMLDRSYPVVNAIHYFEKYAKDGKPQHQFMHALQMMTQGGILRMDTKDKPFSITFVLLDDNGAVKMHHMIDDEWISETFGQMFNDPYEGPKKRQTCYKHLSEGFTEGCEKCVLERDSQICMNHDNVLSSCVKCKKTSSILKEGLDEKDAQEIITAILKVHKKQYWSFGGPKN